MSKASDISRTNMFDEGQVTVLFTKLNSQNGPIQTGISMDFAPGGLSDWSFTRLTISNRAERTFGRFGARVRSLIGRTWQNDNGIPVQERYTVEGAGSGDMYRKFYLRDESSFYGDTDMRSRYHLAGDGNLRAFGNQGLVGVEEITAATVETFLTQSIAGLRIELATFIDMGILTGSKLFKGDNGFNSTSLVDYGIGIRLSKNIFGQAFYLRFDKPLSATVDGESIKNMNDWVFSFQKSI